METPQCKRHGLNPWVRNILWWKKWQPTSVFLPGKSRGQRSLVGYSLWGCKELDVTEQQLQKTICPSPSAYRREGWLLSCTHGEWGLGGAPCWRDGATQLWYSSVPPAIMTLLKSCLYCRSQKPRNYIPSIICWPTSGFKSSNKRHAWKTGRYNKGRNHIIGF